jgi:signal transduction histidine kinase
MGFISEDAIKTFFPIDNTYLNSQYILYNETRVPCNICNFMMKSKTCEKISGFIFTQNTFLFLFLFLNVSAFSQEKAYDKGRDSIVVLLNEYSKTKQPEIPAEAFLFAEEMKIDSLLKFTYVNFGMKSYFNKDLANLTLTKNKLRALYLKTKDSSVLAKQYYYSSLFFKIQSIPDSTFYYLHKSKNISIQLKDSLEAARRLLSMAALQYRGKDFSGSESSVIEGLRLVEPLDEFFFTGLLYERLANVLFSTEREEEARKNYLKFFELQKRIPNVKLKYERARLNVHLAKTYESEGNYRKAIEYFEKCFSTDSIKFKQVYRYESSLEGFSYAHFMLGNKKLALKGYLEVLKSRKDRGYKIGLTYSYSLLGELYASNNNKKKAIFYTEKALQNTKELRAPTKNLENLLFLSRLVKGEKGRQYLEARILLNDSLYKRERSLKNRFTKVRYETEKKEAENASLKQENSRKQLALESQRQQKTIAWLLVGVGFLVIVIGYSIVSTRRKKLIFKAKMQQIESREKERQQIAKSLHDEVAGDIRMLHLSLTKTAQTAAAKSLHIIKENVRNLSHQLSSESFEKVLFKDQIINLVSDLFDPKFRIKIQEIDDVTWQKVNNAIKRTLFLAIREGVQNAKQHAEASVVVLNFKETKKAVFLTISDNGKGFDTTSKKEGIGLKNMQERIEEINGLFTIESALQKGTKINIEIFKSGK